MGNTNDDYKTFITEQFKHTIVQHKKISSVARDWFNEKGERECSSPADSEWLAKQLGLIAELDTIAEHIQQLSNEALILTRVIQ